MTCNNDSSFSWFDLSKYEPTETFDIVAWAGQLYKRRFIHRFYQDEFIGRRSYMRAKEHVCSIKDDPVKSYGLNLEQGSSSVGDTTYSDLISESYFNKELKDIFKWSDDEVITKNNLLLIPKRNMGSPYDRAMLTIELAGTDEQIKSDFSRWLHEHRKTTNYKGRENFFTIKDFEKWNTLKILPYLDLSIIAKAEEKSSTQNMLGRMLFPNEYNVDLTERIRRSVKPLAKLLMESNIIDALIHQAKVT